MKRFGLYFCLGLMSLLSLAALQSCKPNIEYVTERGFDLNPDAYRSEVSLNQPTTIKIMIEEKSELRDNFYMVKYFSAEGNGRGECDRSMRMLKSNEWLQPSLEFDNVSGHKFILFTYTPNTYGSHKMSLTVRNSEGVEKKLNFAFSIPEPKK